MTGNDIREEIKDLLETMVNPNLPEYMRKVSEQYYEIAKSLYDSNPMNLETYNAMVTLVQSKDHAIRAKVIQKRKVDNSNKGNF